MGNTRTTLPASHNLHNGIYRDRTLAQFEERRVLDPDHGTPYEGTVHELPPEDDGMIAPIKRHAGRGKAYPTEAPRAVALADQREKARRARKWWDGLSPKRRAELSRAFPHLKAA